MEIVFKEINEISFDKQDILIIDPCYIDGRLENNWPKFCNKLSDFHGFRKKTNNICELDNDVKMLVVDTAYGDGCYLVKKIGWDKIEMEGEECGVDAGMLCIISVEDAKKLNPNVDTKDGVVIRNYSGTVYAEGDGNITSDEFEVITDGSDDNSYNDEDDYDYWNIFLS